MGPIKWATRAVSAPAVVVEVDVTTRRQTIHGFGGAFTEAASYVWANLSSKAQTRVLEEYWGTEGIGYTTGRVAMNSPDFALGHYSYANKSGDFQLSSFQESLPRDNQWVLPFLRAAIKTKGGKPGAIRLFSAPWSPPAWMKVPFNDQNATEPNASQLGAMDVCRPNSLLAGADVQSAWALYFSKWHTAMATQLGQPFWGFSAQNEPLAHGHMWDCCGYTLDRYTQFLTKYLMPRMQKDHPDLHFLAFDHNPDAIEPWMNGTYSASAALREWAWGAAVHWYSAEPQRGVALNRTHLAHPDKPILHTEGCVCRDLPFPGDSHVPVASDTASASVSAAAKKTQGPRQASTSTSTSTSTSASGTNAKASTSASTKGWWQVAEGSYGVGLMQYMQNWAVGFTDWNMLLDGKGGPFHDRGFGCNAPFMTCPPGNSTCERMAAATDGVVYQAPFFFMAHFSKYLPPGSVIVGAMVCESAGTSTTVSADDGRGISRGSSGATSGALSSGCPAPRGHFWYGPGDEGADGKLAVVSAVQPNGTTVLVALNTGASAVTYRLRDPRMKAKAKAKAKVKAKAKKQLRVAGEQQRVVDSDGHQGLERKRQLRREWEESPTEETAAAATEAGTAAAAGVGGEEEEEEAAEAAITIPAHSIQTLRWNPPTAV
eukprot:g2088.t1